MEQGVREISGEDILLTLDYEATIKHLETGRNKFFEACGESTIDI